MFRLMFMSCRQRHIYTRILKNEIITTLSYEEGKFPHSVIFKMCNIPELYIIFNSAFSLLPLFVREFIPEQVYTLFDYSIT
jgi:hypothetical protein